MSTAALHKAFAEAGVSEELIEEAINELHEEIAESRKEFVTKSHLNEKLQEEITEANKEAVTKSYLDEKLKEVITKPYLDSALARLEISMTKQLYKVVTGVVTAALVIGLAAIALMINLSINLIKL